MKIEKIHIEEFGAFKDFDFCFREGINRLNRENGWGKTTLSVFIRAMFYGFPAKGDRAKDREKYRPWGNGVYGGSLTFSVDGQSYTIYRIFGKAKSGGGDEFHLWDDMTRKESTRWSASIGEELFGINEESFANSVWISQTGCTVTSDIASRLGGQPNLLADVKRSDQVIANMERHLNHLSPTRKTGLIYRKKEEMQELETELLKSSSLDEKIRRLEDGRNEMLEALQELEDQQMELQELQRECSSWQDYLSMREVHDTLQREYLNRDEIWEKQQEKFPNGIPENDELEKWAGVIEEKGQSTIGAAGKDKKETVSDFQEKRLALALTGAGGLFLIGSFAAGFPGRITGILLFVIGVTLLATVTGVLFTVKRNNKGNPNSAEKRLDPEEFRMLLARQREAEAAETAWRELQKADRELRDFYRKYPDFERMAASGMPEKLTGISSIGELNDRMNRMHEDLRKIRLQLQEQEGKIDRCMDERSALTTREEKLALLQTEILNLEKEYQLTERTARYLGEAKEAFSTKFMESIQRDFLKYYRVIDPDQKENLFIDSGYSICVMGGGMPRSNEVLSQGYRDLADFCLRIALMDSMFRMEKPCIILDDPFVNLDEEKYRRACKLLEHVAERYQVLYFCCRN